ncbi:MAG TPA: hypothetical protein VGM92_12155 [Candidatus Kapabacteria bacterium]
MSVAQEVHYDDPLLFSISRDSALPIYTGQPAAVKAGYDWLENVMRNYPRYEIINFLKGRTWNDSMKAFASTFYQMQDDNPLSFFIYTCKPTLPKGFDVYRRFPQLFARKMKELYQEYPQQPRRAFIKKVSEVADDTGITAALLSADIIADVMVEDTIYKKDGYHNIMARVRSTILDVIKGKKIPFSSGTDLRATWEKERESVPDSETVPFPTDGVAASNGTNLSFEYSPSWERKYGDDEPPRIGRWINPNHEYIVFLRMEWIGSDSAKFYFSLLPGMPLYSSVNCGMYPVVDCIVQDPNDDFHLGSSHLLVSEWKRRLRARIEKIVHAPYKIKRKR